MAVTHLDDFRGTERFAIRRRLGAGGMGVVYEAFDQERQQRVALKTILHLEASSLYRFKNEFRNLADLAHPNLVRLFELFSDGDQWFFTMELVEGDDFLEFVCPDRDIPEDDPLTQLGDSLDASTWAVGGGPADSSPTDAGSGHESDTEPQTTQPMTEPESTQDSSTSPSTTHPDFLVGAPSEDAAHETPLASTISVDYSFASVAPREATASDEAGKPQAISGGRQPHLVRLRAALRQIAEVLNELHAQGCLHRDIKPSNVLVTRRGRVVLLDFGLATEIDTRLDPQTTEGRVVGTVSYMAPEQAASQPLGPASDWYSVGVMLYRALTGRLPFKGKPLEVMLAKQSIEPVPPSTLNPSAPVDLDVLCTELLRRRPEDRPSGEDVLRRLGSTPSGPARLGSRARPFVGRTSQLAALGETFADLCRGQTVAAFVHGRSGVGKTACVQRFVDGLMERGEAVVLTGRCYEQESVAYKALDSLIDALSRYLKRLSRLEVDALLPRDVAALARVFPVLRRIDAVAEAPQRAAEIPDQQELRRRAFAALREMLARIGDRKPLVLEIDDLQWGDLDSAALLIDLLRPPDPPVLMLVCAYRREDRTTSACLQTMFEAAADVPVLASRRDVPVEPLSSEEGCELAVALIGQDDPAARNVARMIVGEAGGSPYFVYELVQYLKEGGELADSLANSSTISLDNVLWRRINKLPRQPRELLEVLAVAGQPLRQAVACRAAGQGADGYASLALLRSQHMIRGTGPGMLDDVETYHDRIRETIANRLEPSRRVLWQAGLARELEATGDADPEMLARHFEGSGDPVRAGLYYGRAADEAADALAFDHAAKLYRRALALRPDDDADRRPLLARLGDALANSGRSLEAARSYQQATEGASPDELLDLQRRAAYQFFCSGYIDDGRATIGAVLDRVGLRMPATPSEALVRLMIERLILRLRGLRFRARAEAEIPADERPRLDAALAVALGISNVDVIRGAYFQTHSLRLALHAGEPVRVAPLAGLGGRPFRLQRPARPPTDRPTDPGRGQCGRSTRRPPRPRYGRTRALRRQLPRRAVRLRDRPWRPRPGHLPRPLHGCLLGTHHDRPLRALEPLLCRPAGRPARTPGRGRQGGP